jgi:hypothetical protein
MNDWYANPILSRSAPLAPGRAQQGVRRSGRPARASIAADHLALRLAASALLAGGLARRVVGGGRGGGPLTVARQPRTVTWRTSIGSARMSRVSQLAPCWQHR